MVQRIEQFSAPESLRDIGGDPAKFVAAVPEFSFARLLDPVERVAGSRKLLQQAVLVQQDNRKCIAVIPAGGLGSRTQRQVNPVAVGQLHEIGISGPLRL